MLAFKRSLEVRGIQILDPLMLFKAKCHNFAKLPNQKQRNDKKHLLILLEILPAHFRYMLELALQHGHQDSDRSFLREVKFFRSFKKEKWVRRALSGLVVELDSALPIERFRASGLPKLTRYTEKSWPA